jgi:hypothetical protein
MAMFTCAVRRAVEAEYSIFSDAATIRSRNPEFRELVKALVAARAAGDNIIARDMAMIERPGETRTYYQRFVEAKAALAEYDAQHPELAAAVVARVQAAVGIYLLGEAEDA